MASFVHIRRVEEAMGDHNWTLKPCPEGVSRSSGSRWNWVASEITGNTDRHGIAVLCCFAPVLFYAGVARLNQPPSQIDQRSLYAQKETAL
jgi:hypothetical protein